MARKTASWTVEPRAVKPWPRIRMTVWAGANAAEVAEGEEDLLVVEVEVEVEGVVMDVVDVGGEVMDVMVVER